MQTQGAVRSSAVTDLSEYDTIDEMVERHPDKFTKNQLLWILRNREENGLNDAVVKLGKRIYLHRPGFTRWFANQQ